jgi:hypothetical protein
MMSNEVRPEQVYLFWEMMQQHYDSEVLDKPTAMEMRVLGWLLDLFCVVDRKTFLERFTTTIGRRIYIPFFVGVDHSRHPLWSQIGTCVHEHQHIVQLDRDGVRFTIDYLFDQASRAAYEAEAYTCNQELHFWRTGELRSPRKLAEKLRYYGCRETDIAVAESQLIAASRAIRGGAVITEAGQVAIAWLEAHYPQLKHGGEE